MFGDTVITVQKNFDRYYRSGVRLLVQRVKSHKLASNACQITVFVQIFCNRCPITYTMHLYVISSIVILSYSTTE